MGRDMDAGDDDCAVIYANPCRSGLPLDRAGRPSKWPTVCAKGRYAFGINRTAHRAYAEYARQCLAACSPISSYEYRYSLRLRLSHPAEGP